MRRGGDTPEPQTLKLKINQPGTPVYSFGYLRDNVFTMICHSINDICLALENGQIVGGGQGDPFSYMQEYWAPKMAEQGYNVTSYQIRTEEYEMGDIVKDWDSYVVI